MNLRGTLDLGQLVHGFVTHPHGCVFSVEAAASVRLLDREHDTVTSIPVVRYSKQVIAQRPLQIHPAPEIFRSARVERREGQGGHLRGVAEEHDPVYVSPIRSGSPFIARHGRELARFVVPVGDLHYPRPNRLGQSLVPEYRIDVWRVGIHAVADLSISRERLRRIIAGDRRGEGMFAYGTARVLHQRKGTEVFRMVGDDVPIQRNPDLESLAVFAARDFFPLCPAIGGPAWGRELQWSRG